MPDNPARLNRRTLFKGGVTAAAVATVGSELALPAAAQAAAAQATPVTAAPASSPTSVIDYIITCDSWAARPPANPLTMNTGTTQKIVVHHTAYPNSTDYSANEAIWLARDIQRLHMDANGWSDTGQHFTVSRGGFVLEGRHGSLDGLRSGLQQVVAAHSPGENGRGIGIENEGIYITDTPPQLLLDSLRDLCVAICAQYHIGPNTIFGHWDFRATECPGITFYRLFPKLRLDVARRLGVKAKDVPPRTWPNVFSSSTGAVVSLAQYLLRGLGYPVTPKAAYDTATRSAISDFQTLHGMTPTGLGELTDGTWELLLNPLPTGTDAISGIQNILKPRGYQVEITGVYDDATAAAVKELQHLHRLPANGKLDIDTWCAISGGIVRAEFEDDEA